jgi:hypothetical protein
VLFFVVIHLRDILKAPPKFYLEAIATMLKALASLLGLLVLTVDASDAFGGPVTRLNISISNIILGTSSTPSKMTVGVGSTWVFQNPPNSGILLNGSPATPSELRTMWLKEKPACDMTGDQSQDQSVSPNMVITLVCNSSAVSVPFSQTKTIKQLKLGLGFSPASVVTDDNWVWTFNSNGSSALKVSGEVATPQEIKAGMVCDLVGMASVKPDVGPNTISSMTCPPASVFAARDVVKSFSTGSSTTPASITMTNDWVWTFSAPNAIDLKINGVASAMSALREGAICVAAGNLAANPLIGPNVMTSADCAINTLEVKDTRGDILSIVLASGTNPGSITTKNNWVWKFKDTDYAGLTLDGIPALPMQLKPNFSCLINGRRAENPLVGPNFLDKLTCFNGTYVKKRGSIKKVNPTTPSSAGSVTMANDWVWRFKGTGTSVPMILGEPVAITQLVEKMGCSLVGIAALDPVAGPNVLTSFDCHPANWVSKKAQVKRVKIGANGGPTAVTMLNDWVWTLNPGSSTLTVDGVSAEPDKLKEKMSCNLTGTASTSDPLLGSNVISSLACSDSTNIKKKVSIAFVNSSTSPATVTMANGLVWTFKMVGDIGLSLDGFKAVPQQLKANMGCTLTGSQALPPKITPNIISTLECVTRPLISKRISIKGINVNDAELPVSITTKNGWAWDLPPGEVEIGIDGVPASAQHLKVNMSCDLSGIRGEDPLVGPNLATKLACISSKWIKKRAKLSKISPADGASPPSVTMANGWVWTFNTSGNIGLTLDGAPATLQQLAENMPCDLEGSAPLDPAAGVNKISTLSCSSTKLIAKKATIKSVALGSTGDPATVTMMNDWVWTFAESGDLGLTIDDEPAAPDQLLERMGCHLIGQASVDPIYGTNVISSLDCSSTRLISKSGSIKSVALGNATKPASVTMANGWEWSFQNGGDIGLTIDGVAAVPEQLSESMRCELQGLLAANPATGPNSISSMDCMGEGRELTFDMIKGMRCEVVGQYEDEDALSGPIKVTKMTCTEGGKVAATRYEKVGIVEEVMMPDGSKPAGIIFDDMEWAFNGKAGELLGLKIDGQPRVPKDLKAGQSCTLVGQESADEDVMPHVITTLTCSAM